MAVKYERPRVDTLRASEIVELLGPVQGYSGSGEPRSIESAMTGIGSASGLDR
jgi:hypothetical protein